MKFSRGDVVSAGLTLVVGGITYWIGGRNAAFVALGVGALLILVAHFMRGKHTEILPVMPPQPANVSGTKITDLRTGDTKTGDIHFQPVIQIGTVHPLTPPPRPTPPVKENPPQSKPKIAFKNVRAAWTWYSEHDNYFVEVQDRQQASARAVIARFKNESSAHGANEASYIRAELVLRDINEQELEQGVHAACWLREHTDTVDFSVGEDHWVLLGLIDRDDNNYWIVPWKQMKRSWEGTWYELEGHRLTGMRSVEIRLIGETNKWVSSPVVIDIVVNNGEPTVAVRSPAK